MAMDSVLAREEFVRHIFAIEQGFERMLDDALNSFSDYASSITKSGTDPKRIWLAFGDGKWLQTRPEALGLQQAMDTGEKQPLARRGLG